MWRGLAEIAEKYLKKGSTAYFEGKLYTRSWEDGKGQKKYSTEIVVDDMQMLGGRQTEGASPAGGSAPSSSMPHAPEIDLPF